MSWLSDRSHAALSGLGISTPKELTGLDPTTHPLSQEELASAAKAAVAYAVDPSGLTSAQIVAAQVAKSRAAAAAAAAAVAAASSPPAVVLDAGQLLPPVDLAALASGAGAGAGAGAGSGSGFGLLVVAGALVLLLSAAKRKG